MPSDPTTPSATPDKTASRRDPLPAYCFKVDFKLGNGTASAFFRSVSGLRYESEVIDIRAGGVKDTTFHVVGATKWSNLVLKRGFTGTSELLDWRQRWLSPIKQGEKRDRINGSIIQLDGSLKPMGTWQFMQAMPVKWEVSDFDASKSEVSIETLEIAHHGLIYTKAV